MSFLWSFRFHRGHALRILPRAFGDGGVSVVLWDDVCWGEVLFALRRAS